MPIIRQADATQETASPAHLDRGFGGYVARLFSDDGGLTQFGAFTETLAPVSRSGNAHWHENEDEFVYVLTGQVDVVEGDTSTTLYPGDAATFKAGVAVGHYLVNSSDAPTTYLVVGTRAAKDVAHLTDSDAILTRDGARKIWTDAAGNPIKR